MRHYVGFQRVIMERLSQSEIEFITQRLKCLENCTIRQIVKYLVHHKR